MNISAALVAFLLFAYLSVCEAFSRFCELMPEIKYIRSFFSPKIHSIPLFLQIKAT